MHISHISDTIDERTSHGDDSMDLMALLAEMLRLRSMLMAWHLAD